VSMHKIMVINFRKFCYMTYDWKLANFKSAIPSDGTNSISPGQAIGAKYGHNCSVNDKSMKFGTNTLQLI